MTPLRLALFCALAGFGVMPVASRADEDQQQGQKPQEEIPDFSAIDDYIYVPKTTLNVGFRYTGGTKATFKGNGKIPTPSTDSLGDATTPNIQRTYHDGAVGSDTRTITVDNGNGTTSQVPVPSDGKTNTWDYQTANQVDPNGLMTFSSYSGRTADALTHNGTSKGNIGMELSVARDMGDIGKHFSWKLFAGMSVSDINAGLASPVHGLVTTTTDTYDLFGQTPPAAPGSSPSTTVQTVVDSSGNQVTDANGVGETQTVDTSTLLGNAPINRNTTTDVADNTTISNHWKVHGAYFSFRAGPSFIWNLGSRFHIGVSAGPALIYAGTNYSVSEILNAKTGVPVEDDFSDTESKVIIGYYADVTAQYDISERTGLYLGGYFQDAGHYNQTINDPNATYTTKIDLSNQEGLRSGLTFKF